ncbi:hypothetical protein CHS0354_004085 [Potamilus streckersoni]|uniref:Uncharacterized protein n=1 Tax=Potamilus streckersoni TaxID=2493646 RepID=A0AAE0WC13_9BIVA|nr:hypothetical protein CHS0354_004085 [Potamilus streckersoni]
MKLLGRREPLVSLQPLCIVTRTALKAVGPGSRFQDENAPGPNSLVSIYEGIGNLDRIEKPDGLHKVGHDRGPMPGFMMMPSGGKPVRDRAITTFRMFVLVANATPHLLERGGYVRRGLRPPLQVSPVGFRDFGSANKIYCTNNELKG